MPIKIIAISLLLFLSKISYTQHPPEYLSFQFIDSMENVINPNLEIIETDISIIGDEDYFDLKIHKDTFHIIDKEKSDAYAMIINSDGYHYAPMAGNGHFLGQEIKVTARYKDKTMIITFIGQGMERFDCWPYALNISFEEGNFLYYMANNVERKKINEESYNLLLSSKLYKGKVPNDFIMVDELTNINSISDINNFNGLTTRGELLPINEVLDFHEEYSKQRVYRGFLFEENIPIGYCLVEDGINKGFLFSNKYKKYMKEYCRQNGILLHFDR